MLRVVPGSKEKSQSERETLFSNMNIIESDRTTRFESRVFD